MRSLLVLMAAAAACGRGLGPAAPSVPVDSAFVLRPGEGARIAGTPLRIRFEHVLEDTRCPVDVTCVWAGDARVELLVEVENAPAERLHLHTSQGPSAAVSQGYRVTLERLEPAPRSGRTITRYAATFRVQSAP